MYAVCYCFIDFFIAFYHYYLTAYGYYSIKLLETHNELMKHNFPDGLKIKSACVIASSYK